MRAKDSGTNHVRVNLWLTLYKLTGWLASLDLRQRPHPTHPLHRTAYPHTLYDVLVLDGVRGKTMNELDWLWIPMETRTARLHFVCVDRDFFFYSDCLLTSIVITEFKCRSDSCDVQLQV